MGLISSMGSFSGAEVCELVGLYLLSQIIEIIPKHQLGLYWDDGVLVTDARPESLKKKLCEIFRKNGLSLEAYANLKIINYLDVTFDLGKNIFKPYRKLNDETHYVHMKSNHPPNILKNIPLNVNKRLSSISANKEAFDAAKPPYQAALDKAGYQHRLEFIEPNENNENNERRKQKCKRDIIYFNPPFNVNVDTKIGKEFLKIVDTSFPPGNPLHGRLNRHNIKLSYSTTSNMKDQVSRHNSRLKRGEDGEVVAPCPHTRGLDCPFPGSGQYTKTNVIYNATVTSDGGSTVETYIGSTNDFARRYYEHRTNANNPSYRTATTLSVYIWKLKDEGKNFDVSWRIIESIGPDLQL